MGLKLNSQLITTGRGTSKKTAEEDAAKKAFDQLNLA
jgi:dsRNA-specific ribonuclease